MSFPTLVPYGWNEHWSAAFAEAVPAGDGVVPGRVVRHDGVAVAVALPGGVRTLRLGRPLSPPPTVGDWLVVDGDAPVAVLPRTSLLARRSVRSDAPQQLAANVDVVLVVCGLDRPLRAGRIDRTITLAWEAGAVPMVVLAKADRATGTTADVVDRVRTTHPGVEVLATSAVTGEGLDPLRAAVRDRAVAMIGESGAGKSSLANALVGDAVAAVGEVRAGDAKGRHTTTTRQAHLLPGGGVLIDAPGLREVALWADSDAVSTTFADVDELAAGCRFSDCAHGGEPGCAVAEAVAEGRLAGGRLTAWRELADEAASRHRRPDQRPPRRDGRPGRRPRSAPPSADG